MQKLLTLAGLVSSASAHATFLGGDGAQGHAFTVSDLKSGNFTVANVNMIPPHKWDSWAPGSTAIVTVEGTTKKQILAGTFKWQIYETGVTSFIASGNAPYFNCDNKGCDPASPVALKWKTGTTGDFTLTLQAALPQPKAASKDFRLVIWGEDQDHEPYDFSATINFSYGASNGEVLFQQQPQEGQESAKAAAQLTVHHADNGLGSGGDAHCMEMTVSDPAHNQYWAAHSYQYPPALWPQGPCDRQKYNWFNRQTKVADGVSLTTLGIHHKKNSLRGAAAQAPTQMQVQEAAVGDDSEFLYLITNPTSPMGKQHCQELDNPGGTSSKYWAAKGWKYTSPPWKQGKCDRNRFNFVNRETQNLDGYEGVTFWYLGIQV